MAYVDLSGGFTKKPYKSPVSGLFGALSNPFAPKPTNDPWTIAQRRAQAMYQPYLDYLNQQQAADTAAARNVSAQNVAQIHGTTAAQQPIIDQNYNQSIAQDSAVEDSIAKHIANAGASASSDLKSTLANIGQDPALANQLANIYQGVGGAEYASGGASIEQLIGNRAAAHKELSQEEIAAIAGEGKNLDAAIAQIAHDTGQSKGQILAQLPQDVQQIYQTGQQVRTDNRNFAYQRSQDIQNRMDARHKLALETKLTMQQTMSAKEYKVWSKKFDAQQKALDRQSREQIAAANRAATQGNDYSKIKVTGPSSQQYITVPDANGNPTVVKNPNYIPPNSKKSTSRSSDTVDTAGSSKRNRAYTTALASVFNANTGRVRDVVSYAQDSNMKALNLINAALKGMGVDPYSTAGNQIRQSIWAFLDGKPAGKQGGHFVDPRKDDSRFKPKKKK